MAISTTNKRAAHNCHAWASDDTIRCAAERALSRERSDGNYDPETRITIMRARQDFHSFGGEIPPIVKEVISITTDEPIYPEGLYTRYENRAYCDSCGHGCMNG